MTLNKTCWCSAGMTPINHPLWFPLKQSPGSFPHSLHIAPARKGTHCPHARRGPLQHPYELLKLCAAGFVSPSGRSKAPASFGHRVGRVAVGPGVGVAFKARPGSPAVPFCLFFLGGEGSPTKMDCRKKGCPDSNLSTEGPSRHEDPLFGNL